MPQIVGIRFSKTPKVYYFEAGDHVFTEGGGVIVETSRGVEYGTVAVMPKYVDDSEIVPPLKPIIRVATERDEQRRRENAEKRDETMRVAGEIIAQSGLEMKLVDAEYAIEGGKLLLYFTAEGRVDFRDLVRKLASTFHTRIELRQIGARDECKMIGGIGPCGRACCCSDHTYDFPKVSIKMAKNQNLSLNPGKISGLCGRLMCCLAYENAHYVETNKRMPKMGSTVFTKTKKKGVVVGLNQLREIVRLKYEQGDKTEFEEVALGDIASKGKGSAQDDADKIEASAELKKLQD